jgi:sialate O-acetylesterase
MNRFLSSLAAVLLLHTPLVAAAEPVPVRGEDLITLPDKVDGLFLHNAFQSNMVLQRQKPIRIWGWSTVGDDVAISFAGQKATAKAGKDGKWQVELKAMEANARPQEMRVKGQAREILLENILIGDVWLLGGQSNMEFEIAKVENGELEVASANFPEIRLLTIPNKADGSDKPNFPGIFEWSDWSKCHFRKGFWDVCSPKTVREMSAIGYIFGRRLHMATRVPIGLIDASVGGTTVEAWTPLEVARKVDAPEVRDMLADWDRQVAEWDPAADLQKEIENHRKRVESFKVQGKDVSALKEPSEERPGPDKNRNFPGNCYKGLIEPLKGLEIKGAIFHQGFNNCFNGSKGIRMYAGVFPEMIRSWRATFNDPQMPFGIISLCTADQAQTEETFCEKMVDVGPELREVQYRTFLNLRKAGDAHIGYASSYDLRRRWFHPQLKIPAGERIARWALDTQYGIKQPWEPPVIVEVKAVDGTLQLHFDRPVGNIDDGSEMKGFAISGEDRRYQMADAEHLITRFDKGGKHDRDSKVIVLSSPLVAKPVHFRYAWARNPMGNIELSRMTDVPLATQRSDRWDVTAVPVDDGEANERKAINMRRSEMKQADLDRRLYEARKLIGENTK